MLKHSTSLSCKYVRYNPKVHKITCFSKTLAKVKDNGHNTRIVSLEVFYSRFNEIDVF